MDPYVQAIIAHHNDLVVGADQAPATHANGIPAAREVGVAEPIRLTASQKRNERRRRARARKASMPRPGIPGQGSARTRRNRRNKKRRQARTRQAQALPVAQPVSEAPEGLVTAAELRVAQPVIQATSSGGGFEPDSMGDAKEEQTPCSPIGFVEEKEGGPPPPSEVGPQANTGMADAFQEALQEIWRLPVAGRDPAPSPALSEVRTDSIMASITSAQRNEVDDPLAFFEREFLNSLPSTFRRAYSSACYDDQWMVATMFADADLQTRTNLEVRSRVADLCSVVTQDGVPSSARAARQWAPRWYHLFTKPRTFFRRRKMLKIHKQTVAQLEYSLMQSLADPESDPVSFPPPIEWVYRMVGHFHAHNVVAGTHYVVQTSNRLFHPRTFAPRRQMVLSAEGARLAQDIHAQLTMAIGLETSAANVLAADTLLRKKMVHPEHNDEPAISERLRGLGVIERLQLASTVLAMFRLGHTASRLHEEVLSSEDLQVGGGIVLPRA